MQLPEGLLVRAKNTVHAFQGLAVFVAWALTVAVFTEEGKTDGRTGFYFVLVSYWEILFDVYLSSMFQSDRWFMCFDVLP